MSIARNLNAEAAASGDDLVTPPAGGMLTPQELLAGSLLVHEVVVPAAVLHPGQAAGAAAGLDGGAERRVRVRPLKVATLALISRAARDDASLVPLLIIKESLVEPALSFDQVRQLHAGLVQFLVTAIHRISGLAADGAAVREAGASAIGEAHLQLARHYGWTPAQVAELTPGQMAVYLAGIAAAADPADGGGAG
jgi:hypothetical protein